MRKPVVLFGFALICVLINEISFGQISSSQSVPPVQKPLAIEAICADGGIIGRGPDTIEWLPDSSSFSYVQRNDAGEHAELWSVDAATGDKKLLLNEAKLGNLITSPNQISSEREKEAVARYQIAGYHWAPDSRHLLFDALGQLWYYTLDGAAVQLTSSSDPSSDPKFSPDGSRLAYIRKHNLYVRSLANDNEKQLTNDKADDLLNGEVDWLYEEELDVRSNYFWSPDGQSIVFLQMNERPVPSYPIVDWLPAHPSVDMAKYPKAGDPNPLVRLGVVSASGGKTKWLNLTDDPDIYIPRFGWVRDGIVWAEVLNRRQDMIELYFVDTRTGHSRKVLTEATPNAWVNINDDFRILASGDRFIWSSWRDGHTHLYLYSFDKDNPLNSDAQLRLQLTKGDFEVIGVNGVDDTTALIYFTCTKDDPRQRQIYSVKLDGSGMQRVSRQDGWHIATFTDDGKHYVDVFSATLTPPSVSACAPTKPCKKIWESRPVNGFGLIEPREMEFQADDGTKLYGELVMPTQTQPTSKIPVFVYIYGGPADQTVKNAWMDQLGLFDQLMAQRGFAIFTVDNRGTPGRDKKFQTAIRHEFGDVELHDQLKALDSVLDRYPQLDRNRVAIWGWSNGGAMTLYSMTHSDRFRAGISVAPVSDWRNYDSAYTERYYGLPSENTKAYQDFRPAQMAGKLHGALLLVQGTSDDNTLFQNSVQMIEALIESGKQFSLMLYPGKTHGVSGVADQTHLYHMMEEHLERELK
ncbi:MAG TPA: alpha/beta fold hydrolase [Terriglobales bacterium]